MGLSAKLYVRIPSDAIFDDAGRAIDDGLHKVGHLLRNTIIRNMKRSPATGLVYRKVDPKRTHIASSYGNAPRVDTGALWRSINFKVNGQSVEIGSQGLPNYAKVLEESKGRRGRPFILPAINQSEQQMAALFEKTLKKILGA